MATKQFLTLEGLTTYDGLIKQYIGTEDAKSIKSLTVSGNTVSFYKTADASGTAAYTVNMPDVSGFMSKIENASGGKIVTSSANGEVAESDKTLSEIVSSIDSAYATGYAAGESASQALEEISSLSDYVGVIPGGATATNVVSYITEAAMSKGDWSLHGYVVGTSTNGEVYDTEVGVGALENAIAATTGFDDQNTIADAIDAVADDVADKMDKGSGWNGDLVAMTNSDGTIREGLPVNDVTVTSIITGYFGQDGPEAYTIPMLWGSDYTITSSGISVDDITNKIDKIASATGGMIVTSTATGEIAESGTAIDDLATQSDIASFLTGYNFDNSQDKILISHGDPTEGDIEVSTVDIDDIATQTDLSGKMSKGPWNNSTGRIVLTAENGEVAYGSIFGHADSDEIFALTGYGYTPVPGNILIFDTPTNGGLVEDSGVALSDLATKTFVGSIPQGASASTVVGYIDEAVADAAADADISLVEAQTPTTGYLKTYELYQGGNAAANLVGKIDIPKDLVVTSGEIVVNPTGQPAGTYLKLTIANQTAPVYINVADLVDAYTAASGATQVQLAISATNEISATIVAGSVTATELASNSVTTAKIADDAVTADKVAISAHTEAQTAGSDGVAISVTTTDGQVSAVSASIAANTYDTYGAASGVQTSLVGTSSDPASADTINGAKAYADAATTSIPTASIEALFA